MENSFLSEFKERDYFNQCTNSDGLELLMSKKKIRAYIGFDCTASSLHVGSLLQIMCLRLLQKHGHQPIVLLGGGTTRIGDPSGKEETRKILSEKEIEKNIKNIEKIFKVNVIKINIINKQRRIKKARGKKTKVRGYKKAIITLKKGQNIDLTTGI